MAVLSSGPFPRLSLETLAPEETKPLASAWTGGEAVILHGHRNCKTTRQTLPFVDRMHRRRTKGTVAAVLQDDRDTAAALVAEQGLALPVFLEQDPYPLAAQVSLEVVPTVFLIRGDGTVEKAVQGFHKAELEGMAARLGVEGPLFLPEDDAPATRPG
jgi:hypothetical protein